MSAGLLIHWAVAIPIDVGHSRIDIPNHVVPKNKIYLQVPPMAIQLRLTLALYQSIVNSVTGNLLKPVSYLG